MRSWNRAEPLLLDLRQAIRRLRRDWLPSAVVILTLAVAIGMNAAIFGVLNAVVLRPLAYPQADRLAWISTVAAEDDRGFVTGPDFVSWRAQSRSFDRMAAYGTVQYTLASADGATRVHAALVSGDFWDLTGAGPVAGRLPRSGEDSAVLVSATFARRWFGGGEEVAIGRPVTLNGRDVIVVGVLPESFRFDLPQSTQPGFGSEGVDIYEPMAVSSERGGPAALVSVVGRLRPGSTIEDARAELGVIRSHVALAHPNPFDDERALRVVPLREQLTGRARRALLVLIGASAFVLLIACANVAGVLLARSSVRRREVAVRLAVGAGRGRLTAQLLLESLALAVPGSAFGLLLAQVALAGVLRIDPHVMPRLADARVDLPVVAFVLALSLVTALACTLAQAVTLWRIGPADVLRSCVGRRSLAAGHLGTRQVLVAAEVALASMLLIGAALLVKSASRIYAHAPGFAPERVLTATIELAGPQYADAWRSLAFADALLERLAAEPGVAAVSISTSGSMLSPGLMIDGEAAPAPEDLARKPPILINATSAALKHVLGFQMLRGRWFDDGQAEAVVNASLARRDMDGRDPIGRRIRISEGGPLLTVVGVVEGVRYTQLDAPAEPEVYVPYRRVEDGLFGFTALIRTTTDPGSLAAALRRAVAGIDNTQVPEGVMPLAQRLDATVAPRRLNLLLLGIFAAAGLLLAIVGVFGLTAYVVTQRRHEIGVRMALGADGADVVWMVLRQGMTLTAGGMVAGLAGALALSRLIASLLYDVSPADPWTFATVTGLLMTSGLIACAVPAVRAARVDPAEVLRDE